MSLIEKFAKEVFKSENSFTIAITENVRDKRMYHFIKDNVNKATYVYGISYYSDPNYYGKLDCKNKVVAILREGKIYVVDIFFFDIYRYKEDVVLPDNVFVLNDYTAKQDEYISNTIFPEFYNGLETNDSFIAESDRELKKKARGFLFSKTIGLPKIELKPMFNEQDVAYILCGFINFDEEVSKRLNDSKEQWIRKKTTDKKIKSLMENPETVASYEIEIADGIRSVEAKTVTVEFELNGKISSAKISPNTIIRKMVENDYFSGYDFEIAKRGDELIKGLGASTWRSGNNGNELLTCKNITRITYGKKELYVRK